MSTTKYYFILLFIAGMVMIGFLIGPRAPGFLQKNVYVVNIDLPGPFGLSMNGDSGLFMTLASSPSQLLQPKCLLQERPGFVSAAYLLSRPLLFLKKTPSLLHLQVSNTYTNKQEKIHNAVLNFLPEYAAYIILNGFILLMSFFLCMTIIAEKKKQLITGLTITALILGLDIVKAFMWSPHNELLLIMTPLFFIFTIKKTWHTCSFLSQPTALLLSLSAGLLFACYPLFILYLPVLLMTILLTSCKKSCSNKQRIKNFFLLICHSMIFIFPYAIWYTIVKIKLGGLFINGETNFNMFIWIIPLLRHAQFFILFKQLFINAAWFFWQALQQSIGILLLLITTLIFKQFTLKKPLHFYKSHSVIILASIFVSLINWLFFTLVGTLLTWRFVTPMIVAFFPVIGLYITDVNQQLSDKQRRVFLTLISGIIILWLAFIIIKAGPYS